MFVHYRQEGWRLENEDANDKNSPIVFKGVVFNEMKGVFVSNFFQSVWEAKWKFMSFIRYYSTT